MRPPGGEGGKQGWRCACVRACLSVRVRGVRACMRPPEVLAPGPCRCACRTHHNTGQPGRRCPPHNPRMPHPLTTITAAGMSFMAEDHVTFFHRYTLLTQRTTSVTLCAEVFQLTAAM